MKESREQICLICYGNEANFCGSCADKRIDLARSKQDKKWEKKVEKLKQKIKENDKTETKEEVMNSELERLGCDTKCKVTKWSMPVPKTILEWIDEILLEKKGLVEK